MKPTWKLACVVFVLAAGPGCESDTGGPVEAPAISPATIQGFVTNGGVQIGLAEVSISGNGIVRTARSGQNGFRFADLPPGSYTLRATGQGFVCEPTIAEVEAGESVTASIACASQPVDTGTVVGTVTAGGRPLPGVLMLVVDNPQARATDASGRFALDLSPGAYTVFPLPRTIPGSSCGSASVVVENTRTVTVEIVCQPTGRLSGTIRWPNGSGIAQGRVTVSGPVSREAEISSGGFVLDGLPPGSYAVSAFAGGGLGCESTAATVDLARATSVEIGCDFFSREIPGSWRMSLPRDVVDFDDQPLFTQAGTCPAPLPEEEAVQTIVSGSDAGTISIAGLDPVGAISGRTQDRCADFCGILQTQLEFSGIGRGISSNGTSVSSEVTLFFEFSALTPGVVFGNMTRTHRDIAGDAVCVETYWIEGGKL